MKSILKLKFIFPVITMLIGIIGSYIYKENTIAILSLSVSIVGCEWIIIINSDLNKIYKTIYLKENSILNDVKIDGIDLDDPVIAYQGKKLVNLFMDQISQLSRRDMKLSYELNSTLRIKMVQSLKKSAFTTFVVSKVSDDWKKKINTAYQNTCDEACNRILNDFVKVFIIDDINDYTCDIDMLIKSLITKGYTVKIIISDLLEMHDIEVIDFGLWDDKWVTVLIEDLNNDPLLRVRYLGQLDDIYKYKTLSKKIFNLASDYDTWLNNLNKYVDHMDSDPSRIIALNRGIENEILKSESMIAAIVSEFKLFNNKKIAVLDSSELIIKELVRNINKNNFDLLYNGIIPFEVSNNGIREERIKELRKNKSSYDFLLAIGTFNNRLRWQIRFSLDTINNLLKKGGSCILVTVELNEDQYHLAKDQKSSRFSHKKVDSLISLTDQAIHYGFFNENLGNLNIKGFCKDLTNYEQNIINKDNSLGVNEMGICTSREYINSIKNKFRIERMTSSFDDENSITQISLYKFIKD